MKSLRVALLVSGIVVVVLALTVLVWVASRSTVGAGNPEASAPATSAPATSAPAESSAPTGPPQLVRENSHVLDDGGEGAVTVVEFLDFECPACGAAYPLTEEWRKKYAGKITYVVRYFPLPSHANAMNAALAAEAAAQQGKFEQMYQALFESQATWAGAGQSQAGMFRSLAEDLGLDLTAYDKTVADPATEARIQSDFDEGVALGITSIPSFFVNDELQDPKNWTDISDAIDEELAQ